MSDAIIDIAKNATQRLLTQNNTNSGKTANMLANQINNALYGGKQ